MLRIIKKIFLGLFVLIVLSVSAGAIYWHLHPIPITDPKMLLHVALGGGVNAPSAAQVAQRLQVPAGFHISIYASDLPGVRMLRFTAAGDLVVSRPRAGEINLLLRNPKNPAQSVGRRVLLSGLSKPHGVDIHEGWLYVGETDAIGRVRIDEQGGQLQGDYQRIVTGLTGNENHWSKTVRIGPDNYLYVAQGSTCNVCEEKDKRRATIMRFQLDGSGGEIYATGLRNSVGLDWAPWDQQLYATDNGRDLLGDDFPPCELNRIVQRGFYGWPYINGFGELDPDLGNGKEDLLATAISPAFGFRAHNAPLGIHFLRDAKRPASNASTNWAHAALVALHGSWNRSSPDGYKVVALHWREDGSIEQTDFVTGFERDGNVIGRPVDIAEGPDGAIYISDDYAGVIYRVSYGENSPTSATASVPREIQPGSTAEMISPGERVQLYAQGEALFNKYPCRHCHDPRFASAMRPVRELKNLSARYSIEQLQEFFVTPTPPMPVYPLDEHERRALAVYLLTKDQQ
ncbi:MAG: PQQ-dependent sugar dehydrogenase [Spongiibacteraceae bacterium]